ncbi:hypothetical protein G7054_g9614 [Neopestalotiopsis clavispora]|nr:hypothetical protein G7054_g9614 [Neopestalotiopsis clavispora]
MSPYHFDLFGGAAGWNARCWTSSDDRVRGGKSQSYLDCKPGQHAAVFRGTLDIKTLGGAGFASQRTTDDQGPWDLSQGDGILLKVRGGDSKKYTLTLKDGEELPKRPDGREQSTVSWEYDFAAGGKDHNNKLFVPWSDFKPTYRGKPRPDAKPLDLKAVRRVSFMMRSFFGDQEGPFRLEIESLSVVEDPALSKHDPRQSLGQFSETPGYVVPKKTWRSYLSCGLL